MTRPVGARSFSTNDYRVRPLKMADMVAGRIRQMIARGELTDGEWLPTEPELMEQFGVSRPTLREAFRLLESDSLVTIRRGPPGGARVTVPGPEAAAAQFGMLLTLTGTTLKDVYEARTIIEPAAARRARRGGHRRGPQAARGRPGPAARQRRGPADLRPDDHGVPPERGGAVRQQDADRSGRDAHRDHRPAHRADLSETTRTPEEIEADNRRALRSYERLAEFVGARDGDGAEKHWASHMRGLRQYLIPDADTRVVDLLYDPTSGRREIS